MCAHGAVCSAVSHRPQVGEVLPTEPLGALNVMVLYQVPCLVSDPPGDYQLSISDCSEDTKSTESVVIQMA